MNIDGIPSGRKMNELIAEKVFGFKRHKIVEATIGGFCVEGCDGTDESGEGSCGCDERGPGWKCELCSSIWHEKPIRQTESLSFCRYVLNYSEDIEDAWEVVKKLQSTHFKGASLHIDNGFGPFGLQMWDRASQKLLPGTYAKTMPLAICRAALKAVMEK